MISEESSLSCFFEPPFEFASLLVDDADAGDVDDDEDEDEEASSAALLEAAILEGSSIMQSSYVLKLVYGFETSQYDPRA